MRLLPKNHDEGWTPYAWLVYAVPFACWPAMKFGTSTREWVLTLVGLLAFLALYFRGHWERGGRLMLIAAAIVLLGVLYWPWSPAAGAFFIYAAAFAGELDSTRQATVGIALIEGVVLIEAFALGMPWYNTIWPVVFCLLVGSINVHYKQKKVANAKLRLAHDEIERLAKTAERERIARDLHDLLGHTLSVIILKSELASKLAERDVERARAEIRDVERISRDALTQVRAAVRGYREGGLKSELDSAREALKSAGMDVTVDAHPVNLPAAQEAVLALAIREAVTNIVRHSRAKRCRIAVETRGPHCIATISDDGVGGSAPSGIGLTGMRERVEALGGTLARDGAGGTTITVTLPLALPFSAGRERSA
jgi:two-component system sensor histidine kinase DesK